MTYLALDVHKTHSTVANLDPSEQVQMRKIHTRHPDLAQLLSELPRPWIVALEATRQSPAVCAWLRELDTEIHLVDPQKLSALATVRAAKTDAKDAGLLFDALLHDYLPEAYLVSLAVMENRELTRGHTALRRASTYFRNLLRGLLARQGEDLAPRDLCGVTAQTLLDELEERLFALPALLCRTFRHLLAEVEAALRQVDAEIRTRVAPCRWPSGSWPNLARGH